MLSPLAYFPKGQKQIFKIHQSSPNCWLFLYRSCSYACIFPSISLTWKRGFLIFWNVFQIKLLRRKYPNRANNQKTFWKIRQTLRYHKAPQMQTAHLIRLLGLDEKVPDLSVLLPQSLPLDLRCGTDRRVRVHFCNEITNSCLISSFIMMYVSQFAAANTQPTNELLRSIFWSRWE